MSKIKIKDYYSPDIDKVWNWTPDSLKDVNFLIELNIGRIESEGSDIFTAQVMSLEVLQELDSKMLSGREIIIVKEYSWDLLVSTLTEIVEKCTTESWEESAQKLNRYFGWEYEDYVEVDG